MNHTNDEIWFEEELGFCGEHTELELLSSDAGYKTVPQQILDEAQGVIRVHQPQWLLLNSSELMTGGMSAQFCLIRLGYEFYIPQNIYKKGYGFINARCEAYLWSSVEPQPKVYDLFPRDLYETDEAKTTTIKIKPELKLELAGVGINLDLGEIQTGRIEAETIGYFGKEQCMPFWEIEPQSKSLLGIRNFWAIIQVPKQHESIRLSARAEGMIRTSIGPINIGPKTRVWGQRPSIKLFLNQASNGNGILDDKSPGIDPLLYRRLREILLKCGPFNTDQELRAVFIDQRISVWRDKLPETYERTKRVNGVIDFLYRQDNEKKENALVLFLRVLSEQLSNQDTCHQQLVEMSHKLEAFQKTHN